MQGVRFYEIRHRKVFYFTCDHGCKVFFDELGIPWPLHRCIELLVATYGKEVVERGMEVMMMTPGIEIDRDYADRVQQAHRRAATQPVKQQPQIVRQDPYYGVIADQFGIIRDLIRDVNVFKRFNIPKTGMGSALLGELAKGRYAQVTIHTRALAGEDNFSFTFLVSHEMIDEQGVIVGDLIVCRLRGIVIARQEPVWLCESLGFG